MNRSRKPIRNLSGSLINEHEQNFYNELLPYNWDHVYLFFKAEMTMFHNVVHLVKNTRVEQMPPIAGCTPLQYLPFMKTVERIYDSIKRLEEVPHDSRQPPRLRTPINSKVKEFAITQGIDLVGFTTIEHNWVFPYSDNWTYPQKYQPIKYEHVISLGMEMSHDVLHINRFPDTETLSEALHTYAKLGEAVEMIVRYVRDLGYHARGHHPFAGDFLYSAHAVKAGLGQLGANGLVLTKQYGPRQRFAAITTDAPIKVTEPREIGVDGLCRKCMRCVTVCPAKALSPYKVNWRGTLKWQLNNGRCSPNFIAYNGCGLCLIVCPWNKEDTWYHRIVSNSVKWSGLFRWVLLMVDNIFYWRNAHTNPIKNRMKPDTGPLSYANLLEIMGREKAEKIPS